MSEGFSVSVALFPLSSSSVLHHSVSNRTEKKALGPPREERANLARGLSLPSKKKERSILEILTLASFSPLPLASASALFFAETRSNCAPSATPSAAWASARLICGDDDGWAGEGDAASEGSGEDDDDEEAALAETSRWRRRW